MLDPKLILLGLQAGAKLAGWWNGRQAARRQDDSYYREVGECGLAWYAVPPSMAEEFAAARIAGPASQVVGAVLAKVPQLREAVLGEWRMFERRFPGYAILAGPSNKGG